MTEENKPVEIFTEVDIPEALMSAVSIAQREQVLPGNMTVEQATEVLKRTAFFMDALLRGDVIEVHNEEPIKVSPRSAYQELSGDADKSDNLIIGG